MKKEKLLNNLDLLGYPLLKTQEDLQANKTLAEVIKSRDLRLWEGFPVMLVNSIEKKLFDYAEVKKHLKKRTDKQTLNCLLVISLGLFKALGLKFAWADELRAMSLAKKKDTEEIYKKIKVDEKINVSGKPISTQRLKDIFNNYSEKTESGLGNFLSAREEFSLEYSLSQVLTARQKEIFFKKLRGEKLSKTEKEYYSRVIKKKVIALANPQLHRLAQKLS